MFFVGFQNYMQEINAIYFLPLDLRYKSLKNFQNKILPISNIKKKSKMKDMKKGRNYPLH